MSADPVEARRQHARTIAAAHGHYAYTIDSCPECTEKLEAWDEQRAAVSSAPPPVLNAATDTARAASGAVRVSSSAAVAGVPTTPEALLAALDAAPDDAARARLLAGTSRELRSKFNAMLIYRKLSEVDPADAARDAQYAEFSARLDGAADDGERLGLIEATDKKFLAEWAWRQNANPDAWRRRYLAMCGAPAESD